jgi:phosphatidylinositol kinase/protein kinase (PI-3  family)
MCLRCLRNQLKEPELEFQFRHMFAKQWAVNCLNQYAFAVAERIPSKVVFLTNSGKCLSPDFRVNYNGHGGVTAQIIPFRMTPNISRLIGYPLVDGCFVVTMIAVAQAICANKEHLLPVLSLLMRDDSTFFFTKSMAKSDSKTQEMERQLMDRVSSNVSYVLARFHECSFQLSSTNQPITLEGTDGVRVLLQQAQASEKLCMMPPHYQPWL